MLKRVSSVINQLDLPSYFKSLNFLLFPFLQTCKLSYPCNYFFKCVASQFDCKNHFIFPNQKTFITLHTALLDNIHFALTQLIFSLSHVFFQSSIHLIHFSSLFAFFHPATYFIFLCKQTKINFKTWIRNTFYFSSCFTKCFSFFGLVFALQVIFCKFWFIYHSQNI